MVSKHIKIHRQPRSLEIILSSIRFTENLYLHRHVEPLLLPESLRIEGIVPPRMVVYRNDLSFI